MSINKRIIVCFLMVLSSNFVFCQKTCNKDNLPLFLVRLNDPLVEGDYPASKDTSYSDPERMWSVSFYINGYESKQKREKAIREYNKLKKGRYGIYLPAFSVNYITFDKPEKLASLEGNYRTLNELLDYKSVGGVSRICIIVEQADGTYLKWHDIMMMETE